jgi:hypothetical protein
VDHETFQRPILYFAASQRNETHTAIFSSTGVSGPTHEDFVSSESVFFKQAETEIAAKSVETAAAPIAPAA